jgi:hypothetical protein
MTLAISITLCEKRSLKENTSNISSKNEHYYVNFEFSIRCKHNDNLVA